MVVNTRLTLATSTAEREAAIAMLTEIPGGTRRVTVGADRGYYTEDFVKRLRELPVTPHVAQNTSNRSSAIDAWTTRHTSYVISQRRRKRVRQCGTKRNHVLQPDLMEIDERLPVRPGQQVSEEQLLHFPQV